MDDLSHNVISRIRSCTVFYDEDDCTAHARFFLTEGEANKELDRIHAQAKAKALMEAADRAIAWQVKLCKQDDWRCENCDECNQLRAAILADQAPEAEKVEGPQVGDIVALIDTFDLEWYPRHWGNISAYDEQCLKDGALRAVVLMRRAEVERRIQEGR